MTSIRIGSGAGYSGDRIDPAVELAEHGDIRYLGFECLAERTIALAQLARLTDPDAGYDPLLDARFRAVLPVCHRRGITVITNMGAANPAAAARRTREIARELGLSGLKIAYIAGDDVLARVRDDEFELMETGAPASSLGDRIISANAYLGMAPIIEALRAEADVIITGRVADPALFAAPIVHEFGWPTDDWRRMGQATVVGHLLECAGQITGGYFADPGYKDVAGLARLGYPLAEVDADGSAVITKVAGSGGCVTPATCSEQLLYEIHDPARYLTPDVIADFSQVRLEPDGPDRVRVVGAGGRARPERLKVSIGYRDGFIGEGQISYGGAGAVERGRLALDIVRERLALTGVACDEIRAELIGLNALFEGQADQYPPEVRARVAGRTASAQAAACIGNEIEALYTNGPAGGGGSQKSVREVIAVASTLLARSAVSPAVHCLEV
ncbi:acyclic terpene utilization AtuA family protein [Salinisphaera sp. LB1]|uniref:acyclic terpene utilization AtuA family protein n=1 Tax=Salinisphaera sp. LB1 TaxID=2183911 RepID=UPI000D7051A8|nr:acyclic terpene utilization AtuA family protein [Salinisphaera sp. LB1]AWN15987.1 Protein of unknown function DUF1446 [Salinisphaera sp. LB1]